MSPRLATGSSLTPFVIFFDFVLAWLRRKKSFVLKHKILRVLTINTGTDYTLYNTFVKHCFSGVRMAYF